MSRQLNDDHALERLLRTMAEEPGRLTAACVDAEQLAAWSEGGLTAAERETLEGHAASCGRCLAILSVFSDTRSTAEQLEVGTGPVPDRWRWPMRWLVPITTAAAAVLIWMVLPARPPDPANAPTMQVARDEVAPIVPAPPPESALQQLESRGDQARESNVRQAPSAPATIPPPALSKAAEPTAEADQDRRQRQASPASESARIAQEPAAKTADSAAASGQRAANEGFADRMAAGAAPPPPAAAPAAALRRAEAPPSIEISTPDPDVRWRIRGTVVERSTTGGATWQSVTIPAGSVVTGGTAPDRNVCWLIGPAGTVLRAIDGARFESVNISGAAALVSIQAADAHRATVTTTDKQVYSTADGGRTWTR